MEENNNIQLFENKRILVIPSQKEHCSELRSQAFRELRANHSEDREPSIPTSGSHEYGNLELYQRRHQEVHHAEGCLFRNGVPSICQSKKGPLDRLKKGPPGQSDQRSIHFSFPLSLTSFDGTVRCTTRAS